MQAAAVSRDGTEIGYAKLGNGPGLILVQGAMGSAAHYSDLAKALSRFFTVLVPDRRGRGMSPLPYRPGHDVGRDVEDVGAVQTASGARFVFGLSSGAMIALEAARRLPAIEKAALYEPPFYPRGIDRHGIVQFKAEVSRGDLASALVTAGRIVGLAPLPVRLLPKRVARRITGLLLRSDVERGGAYLRLSELVPAMRYDFDVVAGMQDAMVSVSALHKPILVLNGTRSPRYLQTAASRLAAALPRSHRVVLPGLDHSGPWNAEKGGRPGRVSPALLNFFLGSDVSDRADHPPGSGDG